MDTTKIQLHRLKTETDRSRTKHEHTKKSETEKKTQRIHLLDRRPNKGLVRRYFLPNPLSVWCDSANVLQKLII